MYRLVLQFKHLYFSFQHLAPTARRSIKEHDEFIKVHAEMIDSLNGIVIQTKMIQERHESAPISKRRKIDGSLAVVHCPKLHNFPLTRWDKSCSDNSLFPSEIERLIQQFGMGQYKIDTFDKMIRDRVACIDTKFQTVVENFDIKTLIEGSGEFIEDIETINTDLENLIKEYSEGFNNWNT